MSSAKRNYFLADLSASESATKAGVEPATHSKQALARSRFQQYLESIEIISDPYLDSFSSFQKIKILGAFAHALRDGRFYKNNITPKADSIRATIDCVAQTYRMADRPNPRLDHNRKPSFVLLRQIKSYKKMIPQRNNKSP
jgi:hypothetical protein